MPYSHSASNFCAHIRGGRPLQALSPTETSYFVFFISAPNHVGKWRGELSNTGVQPRRRQTGPTNRSLVAAIVGKEVLCCSLSLRVWFITPEFHTTSFLHTPWSARGILQNRYWVGVYAEGERYLAAISPHVQYPTGSLFYL